MTWVDPNGDTKYLLDEPINEYRYPGRPGIEDVGNPYHYHRTNFKPAKVLFVNYISAVR